MNDNMIGSMITKIRKDRNMTKTELARLAQINIGHLTHIEKSERKPSSKSLRKICEALDVPYQQLKIMTDLTVNESQAKYDIPSCIPYNKVLLIEKTGGLIDCPPKHADASVAIKITEDSMEPTLPVGAHAFIQYNMPLINNEIGLFQINEDTLIRRFTSKNDKIVLKADNSTYDDIKIGKNDSFYIIGKILV